jgi:hypothetical protein
MDLSMVVMMLLSWITKKFPSLEQYTEYVIPIAIFSITAFGIFTNMLPKPGHKFPVPDVAELEKELQGGGGLIIRMAKFARTIVISTNWFLGTVIYSWFYNFTNRISTMLSKLSVFLPKKKKV